MWSAVSVRWQFPLAESSTMTLTVQASSDHIPLDVCFITIDILAHDEGDPIEARYTTLRRCALTCQDWLERSRAQLYRSGVLQRWDNFESFADT